MPTIADHLDTVRKFVASVNPDHVLSVRAESDAAYIHLFAGLSASAVAILLPWARRLGADHASIETRPRGSLHLSVTGATPSGLSIRVLSIVDDAPELKAMAAAEFGDDVAVTRLADFVERFAPVPT